ncbi:MAG: aminotransferase class I/II-fold pyridoxal phosphate-dependent enzyme [Actinomycetota bacterium]|nr:aminotransferase class I/II-fold pyridoxal phosphate-dependent enzyme [Actinomycetota bacterium]
MNAYEVPLPVDDLERLRRRRSLKWRSHPRDVLPLPVAEMDFALAPPVRDVLAQAVERSDTGYSFAGTELAQALVGFAAERWSWSIDPSAVVPVPDVGVGCVELLRLIGAAGDAVVINPPVYAPFPRWIAETGRRVVEVPLLHDPAACDVATGGWRLDLEALAAAFAAGARTYLLCSPHNPVGRVHSPGELAAVVRLAHDHGVTVIADEIHAPLVMPGSDLTPFLTVPGAAEIGVSVVSASKAFNLAGLKCAQLVTGSEPMRELAAGVPGDVAARVGHLGVLASIAAYADGGAWLDALLSTLALRHDLLGHLLAERLPQVLRQQPQATYLAWLDCRAIGAGSVPYELFLQHGRVAVEAGPVFGAQGSGWVRFNVATSESILDEGVARMAAALA